ncbi:MAG: hypothetical protein M1812_004704 [Candelaria pacifica]|nr:MAG: hypothetical protein M1812_004704 [Candelaria pacifica]
MPHTSRKKKPTQQKRARVSDEEGWTHIIKGSRSHAWKLPSTFQRREPPSIPSGFSFEKLQQQYEDHRLDWEASQCRSRLEILLSSGVDAVERPKISNAVCLGLGSMLDPEHRKDSFLQLAAFKTMLSTLGLDSTTSQVYAQDPFFNELDKELLKSLSIHVIEDPVAFSHIGPTTFVYGPHCERSILLRALEGRDPALVISTCVEENSAGYEAVADLDLAREFLRGRQSTTFPNFEPEPFAFNGMAIYWGTMRGD